MYPQNTTATQAPMEWEVFQMDILVASLFGGNQCVMSRQHGGKPMPCTQPLNIHAIPRTRTAELKPKTRFAPAERSKPVTMKTRASARSAQIPLTKRETP